MISMISLVISRKNLIKKDVTKHCYILSFEKYCVEKKFPYANIDSRDSIVAVYDSVAGEPSEIV